MWWRNKWRTMLWTHTLTALHPKMPSKWPKNYKKSRRGKKSLSASEKYWRVTRKMWEISITNSPHNTWLKELPSSLDGKQENGINHRTANIHKLRMAGMDQGQVEGMGGKKTSMMRKISIKDTGRYTSAINSQISWPRFSGLVHPKAAAAQGS